MAGRWSMLGILALAALAGVFGGCSSRERLNPLDPRNPHTLGRPTGLRVTSSRHTVTLYWESIDHRNLRGVSVWRRIEGEDDWSLAAVASADSTRFSDAGMAYGRRVDYRISAAAEGYESPPSDSVSITPGPNRYWVADYSAGLTSRLTYDALHADLTTKAAVYPVALDADSTTGVVWVVDALGYLVKLRVNGDPVFWAGGLNAPSEVLYVHDDRNVWVIHGGGTAVVRFDTSGIVRTSTEGFTELRDMCPAQGGGVWLADAGAGEVWRVSAEGNRTFRLGGGIAFPSGLAYARDPGVLWISDGSSLYARYEDGEMSLVHEAGLPVRVFSAEEGTGDCWAVAGEGSEQSVLKVSLTGELPVRLDGFSHVESLTANAYDGGCLVADAGNRRTVRITADGVPAGVLGGFSMPRCVDLE